MSEHNNGNGTLRSEEWFGPKDLEGFLHRAGLKSQGFSESEFQGKPVIGIANSWSELTHCNAHLRELAQHVKRGVAAAGGFPLEFPTISLGEFFISPTSMLLRNLMSMDVEEMIRAAPLDGVVLLSGCDKTTPAMMMGAVSADVPAIVVTGGPQLKGNWRGQDLGSCTDCRRYWVELRAGRITQDEYDSMEEAIYRSPGHCMVMGTASSMGGIAETIGLSLPGGGTIPGADSRRKTHSEEAGRAIVDLVNKGIKPSDVVTPESIDNAIRFLLAVGGSTNAIIHLTAIAGRAGIELPLSHFDELSRTTPMILNLKPSGEYLMEDLYYAGGVEAILSRISPLLNLDEMTVTGKTLGENIADATVHNDRVIRTIENPLFKEGGIVALSGSLAPDGAVIKHTAASPELLTHTGRAVVFEDYEDLHARIDSDDLDVTINDVLVLKNTGPIGGPGMPESGMLPLPKKLLQQGHRDMVRISDARMSGTAFGTVVLHVTPESAIGGPLGLVENGDMILLDTPNRRLDLLVDDAELERRRAVWKAPAAKYNRGYGQMYSQHVLQADGGCDFDFLRGKTPVKLRV
ncbi:MAG: dihydroxy-acid dehydratase [Chloroflexi bacterium]|nr:dihydroxy-acid dehydratase [Chloroflexota bacterium]